MSDESMTPNRAILDEGLRLLLAYQEARQARIRASAKLAAAREVLREHEQRRSEAGQNVAAAWAALENWVRGGRAPVTAVNAPDDPEFDDE